MMNRDSNWGGNTDLYNALDSVSYYENIGEVIGLKYDTSKVPRVVAELVATEKNYVFCLKKIINKYKRYLEKHCPKGLLKELPYLFGNIEMIFEGTTKFLKLLQNSDDVANIATSFVISESLFQLYPEYARNRATADKYYQHFEKIAEVRQQKLNDRVDLRTYLTTPILRMGRYILLLTAIEEELDKTGKSLYHLSSANNIIKREMRKSNDLVAIDLIKQSFINLENQGSFILAERFKVIKPSQKRNKVILFLFEKVLVFTLESSGGYVYLRSIVMSNMGVSTLPQDPLLFQIEDHPEVKRGESEHTKYILRADSARIKNLWTEILQQILWQQLQQAKVENAPPVPENLSKEVVDYLNKLRPLNQLVGAEQQQGIRNLFCM